MLKFKKVLIVKFVSIIIAVSFAVTGNVYPDTIFSKTLLRKPLDFNNPGSIENRYKSAIASATEAVSLENSTDLPEIQTKEEHSKANNISPARRVMFGISTASLSFLSLNLMRYFVIAPNYLEPVRYASVITAVIFASVVIFLMLPEVFTGRPVFGAKERKGSGIRLAALIAGFLSIAPNTFLIWQRDKSLHYIRHEIVTPILGKLDIAGEFVQQPGKKVDLDIRHKAYTADHVIGGMFKERETADVVLVPINGRYEFGVEAIEGRVPFKEATPDHIAKDDPSIILKASGGYSDWDEGGYIFLNHSLVMKKGKIIAEYLPNSKWRHIITITSNGKMIIASTDDYLNGRYPFDGSEKKLSAIHGGFAIMVNGQPTGLAGTYNGIEQSRSWGIVFQCLDKKGERYIGFFNSSGIIHGMTGSSLTQIYRFITEVFAIENALTVTDVMVMESGGWSFLHAELPGGDVISRDSGDTHATSILVVRDTSSIEQYRKLIPKAVQSSENFYNTLITIDTGIFSNFLKMTEQETPGQIDKLTQGLTDAKLLDLLNRSLSLFPYTRVRVLHALIKSASIGDKKSIEILENLMLEREIYSTELVEMASGLGVQKSFIGVISRATKDIIISKIASYHPANNPANVPIEHLFEKEEALRFSSQQDWGALVMELRNGRQLKMPISLYGKRIRMRIKNNLPQPISLQISARSVKSISFTDTAILKNLLVKPGATRTLVLDEIDIAKALKTYGYDIEAFTFSFAGAGDVTLEELTLVDPNAGLEVDLIHDKKQGISQIDSPGIRDRIGALSNELFNNL